MTIRNVTTTASQRRYFINRRLQPTDMKIHFLYQVPQIKSNDFAKNKERFNFF
jgi:hypothetical protein